jgi:hypothetical protein
METCCICYDKRVNAITNCGHKFCISCINNNMIYSLKCPLCRQNIIRIESLTKKTRQFTQIRRSIIIMNKLKQEIHNIELLDTRENRIKNIKKINKIILGNLWFLTKYTNFKDAYIKKMNEFITMEGQDWIYCDLVKVNDYINK